MESSCWFGSGLLKGGEKGLRTPSEMKLTPDPLELPDYQLHPALLSTFLRLYGTFASLDLPHKISLIKAMT